nr:MAG TPA: hypothetical protein [Bacteriophage sp.]
MVGRLFCFILTIARLNCIIIDKSHNAKGGFKAWCTL